MDLETINFEIEDNIAFIELNRPKYYNSLNQTMAEDLFKVSLECDDNPNIRSVMMSGAGEDAFCAGEVAQHIFSISSQSGAASGARPKTIS